MCAYSKVIRDCIVCITIIVSQCIHQNDCLIQLLGVSINDLAYFGNNYSVEIHCLIIGWDW